MSRVILEATGSHTPAARLATIAEHLSRADDLFLEITREIDRRKAEHGDDRLACLRSVASAIRDDLTTVREAAHWQACERLAPPSQEHAEALDRVLAAAWEFAEQCWTSLGTDALEGVAVAATECVSVATSSLEDVWLQVSAAGDHGSNEEADTRAETPAPAESVDQSQETAEASGEATEGADHVITATEARRWKNQRRAARQREQKEIAASWPTAYRETLHLQTGLVRRQLSAGDATGAMEQAAGILEAFVRALYASHTGSISRDQPTDVCLSRLRAARLITEADLFRLVDAKRLIARATCSASATVAEGAAGTALSAVELVAAGKADAATKERNRMKRSIKRRAAKAVADFHSDPSELHHANAALAEITAETEGATDAA